MKYLLNNLYCKYLINRVWIILWLKIFVNKKFEVMKTSGIKIEILPILGEATFLLLLQAIFFLPSSANFSFLLPLHFCSFLRATTRAPSLVPQLLPPLHVVASVSSSSSTASSSSSGKQRLQVVSWSAWARRNSDSPVVSGGAEWW